MSELKTNNINTYDATDIKLKSDLVSNSTENVLVGGVVTAGTTTAPTGGEKLRVNGDAVITGSTTLGNAVTVSTGGIDVDAGGIQVDGGLIVDSGTCRFDESVEVVAGGLTVTAGGASINGTTAVAGNTSVTGNMTVASGTTSLGGALTVSTGGATITGGLEVDGVAFSGGGGGTNNIKASICGELDLTTTTDASGNVTRQMANLNTQNSQNASMTQSGHDIVVTLSPAMSDTAYHVHVSGVNVEVNKDSTSQFTLVLKQECHLGNDETETTSDMHIGILVLDF
tara:strand:+ start:3745 stop:4596 length:852 start_codon:yes stop_codon:yes gene_type:complete